MKRFNKLPDHVKCILQFNSWVMWSFRCECEKLGVSYDFSTDYYAEYNMLRHWSVDAICKLGLSYDDLPDVNASNQNEIFKQSRSKLDLKKFKNVRTHTFEVITSDGKFSPEFA